jgi:hypothetical protein
MTFLKIAFAIILATMLTVTTAASLSENILRIPSIVSTDPWFIATLFDAYFGFLTFYCWVYYKESNPIWRIFWFMAIMLLGNIAMATYMLIKLLRLPGNASFKTLLLAGS